MEKDGGQTETETGTHDSLYRREGKGNEGGTQRLLKAIIILELDAGEKGGIFGRGGGEN